MSTSGNNTIKLLIAEEQEILRAGLRLTVDSFTGMSVIAEALNGIECLRLVKELHPDVVVMDLMLPELNGIDATDRIKQLCPDTKVLFFTSYSRDEDIFAAFAAGADAYCLRDIASEKLELAIRTTATGAVYMDPRIAQRVFAAVGKYPVKQQINEPIPAYRRGETLSTREHEVLKLIVEGHTNAEIAAKLTISTETAKSHVRNVMTKLQVSDRTQAAIKAIRQGLITSD